MAASCCASDSSSSRSKSARSCRAVRAPSAVTPRTQSDNLANLSSLEATPSGSDSSPRHAASMQRYRTPSHPLGPAPPLLQKHAPWSAVPAFLSLVRVTIQPTCSHGSHEPAAATPCESCERIQPHEHIKISSALGLLPCTAASKSICCRAVSLSISRQTLATSRVTRPSGA